jgi:uncharacterized membrane protein YozB (DUF420 family)
MEEYFKVILEQLAVVHFWETRASLYMDLIVSFLVLLPILIGISIFFAMKKKLKLHQFTQFLLFFLTVISLSFFAYIVHFNKGFEVLVQESSIGTRNAFIVLFGHIIISIITLLLWLFALIYAVSDKKRRALPGIYSQSHAKAGKRLFKGIILTSLSSVTLYWILYVA